MSVVVSHRSTCRLCDSRSVKRVLELTPIPLSENYCTNSDAGRNAERYPVDLYMCASCGHVQQLDVIDSKSLWSSYTYFSASANGMPEHFEDIADNVLRSYEPKSGSLVLDVGSNDGSLLRPFKARGFKVLGVDPAEDIAAQATKDGIPTIASLMTTEVAERIVGEHGRASIVTAFNVFAHADALGEMVDAIKEVLAEDGIFIFEAQYLMDIVDKNIIATIFHEHISHHSVKPMIQFLDMHGLELIAVHRSPIQHGSIIGMVQHKGAGRPHEASVGELVRLEDEKKLDKLDTLYAFADRVHDQKKRMMSFMRGVKSLGATVAGYGAARSGATLISQLGLTGMIEFIVDDHPQKLGKYSSGDGIIIQPTSTLLEIQPDYAVILAWVHAQKIIDTNQQYLDNGGKFIVLCPELSVVSKSGVEFL